MLHGFLDFVTGRAHGFLLLDGMGHVEQDLLFTRKYSQIKFIAILDTIGIFGFGKSGTGPQKDGNDIRMVNMAER